MKLSRLLFAVCFALLSGAADSAPTSRAGGAAQQQQGRAQGRQAAPTGPQTRTPARAAVSAPAQQPAVQARAAAPARVAAPAPAPNIVARSATVGVNRQGTPTIAAATGNEALVDQQCRELFDGCMDSFCMAPNENGGRCLCSNQHATFDDLLEQIRRANEESLILATEEVERIERGARAEYIAEMEQRALDNIRILQQQQQVRQRARPTLDLSGLGGAAGTLTFDDLFVEREENITDPLAGRHGDALFAAVRTLCLGRMREQAPHCSRDVSMLSTLYTAQITSDCRAFENDLRARLNDADNRLRAARAAVRDALEESFEHANRWNLGECVTEFRNCMVDRGGCEEDFSGCVGIAAAQSAAMSRRGVVAPRMHRVQIPGQNTFIEIAMSSYDTLVARGHLCENITDQCIMHKDRVWDIFVASVAPAVRTAEIMQESENRQNCISNISECFRRGCADRFNPEREEAEYDLCLTNPAAMVHICRVPLEACGITVDARQNTVEEDHPIWSFVTRRLSAMRDNACLREVRRCMTSENNCGEDYANCIGMDVAFIKRMCPLERMRESCIVDGEAMSASYYDDLIAGILMNIDNAQLRMCTAAVDARLGAMCTARDCSNLFENNNAVGASGIVVESNALTRTIKGLIDFSWIRVNPNPDSNTHRVAQNVVLPIIETVMVQDDETGEDKTLFADYTAAAETQRGINLMIRVINEKVDELVMDERVQMCIGGRRLRQVDGRSALGERTEARFPAIAHAATMTIINAGLQRAQVNHERRRRELIREGQTALERLAAAGVCYDPDLHGPPEWMRTDAGASGGD